MDAKGEERGGYLFILSAQSIEAVVDRKALEAQISDGRKLWATYAVDMPAVLPGSYIAEDYQTDLTEF